MPVFAHLPALPVFSDVPSPFCVSCQHTKFGQGFLDFFSDVNIKDEQGNVLDQTLGYLCFNCARELAAAFELPTASVINKARKAVEQARALLEGAEAESAAWLRVI